VVHAFAGRHLPCDTVQEAPQRAAGDNNRLPGLNIAARWRKPGSVQNALDHGTVDRIR
jgi:hypothetical protein